MIRQLAIENSSGNLVKLFLLNPDESPSIEIGMHQVFGFLPVQKLESRLEARQRQGLHTRDQGFLVQVQIKAKSSGKFSAQVGGTELATQTEEGVWDLPTPRGVYRLRLAEVSQALPLSTAKVATHDRSRLGLAAFFIAAILLTLILPKNRDLIEPQKTEDPIEVHVLAEKRVVIPKYQPPSEESVPSTIQTTPQTKRAIQQNLGFLGILGKKDLKKALGGMPSMIQDASPGAGAGGKEGSGGELLVGLGQGVKRTTVGNSGVAGLGGVGTHGRGGGAGGYGNTWAGSGEGKLASSVALSQDIVLDGGLDRNVIQATIAKYISQVRACYEDGLHGNAGLSGQVQVNFEINSGGGLNFSRVARSTLGNTQVENCITERMLGWKFPKPVGGVTVKVNYPFLLRPTRS